MSNKKKVIKKSTKENLLKDYEISVNEFGEIKTNLDIDAINEFLDENVEDKKLVDREDTKTLRKGIKKANQKDNEDQNE